MTVSLFNRSDFATSENLGGFAIERFRSYAKGGFATNMLYYQDWKYGTKLWYGTVFFCLPVNPST